MPHFQCQDGVLHFLSDDDIARGGIDRLPAGSVEISEDEAREILSAPPPLGQQQAAVRAERDAHLAILDKLTIRHRDQLEDGSATSLSESQYHEVLEIKRLLRDVPNQPGFPSSVEWPELPEWLEGLR